MRREAYEYICKYIHGGHVKDNNIQSYLDKFLNAEFGLAHPFQSNGDLEKKFIYMIDLIRKQDIIIKLLSKQTETSDKIGLLRRWTEFKNTFWRLIIGDPNTIYNDLYAREELSDQIQQFSNFINRVKGGTEYTDIGLPGRLFIDVTSTSRTNYLSGIQRVVFEITKKLMGPNVYPAIIHPDGLFSINKSTSEFEKVRFQKNDVFLMADASIDCADNLSAIIADNSASGGINVTFVYDLIPLNYPLTCGAAIPYKFHNWFNRCALKCDLILTNTKCVMEQVQQYSEMNYKGNQTLAEVNFFHLGSELPSDTSNWHCTKINNFMDSQRNIFLSVGTIEPRKGYSISLDAAEFAWNKGEDFIFVIVGRYGWNQVCVRERILLHREYNKRLFWYNNMDDGDLSSLYKISRSLIFASIDEGFGLPLMEAAQHDLPVIVSDIPVFREIAGPNAVYFEAANSNNLAEKIIQACHSPKNSSKIETISWDRSKLELLSHIKNVIEARRN